MPFRCCVPKCRGNYDGEQTVSVFKFPSDALLKEKWISSIRRDKFTPSRFSRVCILHFQSSDVLWQTEVFDEKTGQKLVAPLKSPRLKNGAIPSVFPNCPSYLSREESCREAPAEKRSRRECSHLSEAISASLASKEHYNNCFKTLDELLLRLKNVSVQKPWTFVHLSPECVGFIKINVSPAPVIALSVIIDINLNVSVFKGKVEIKRIGSECFPKVIMNVNVITTLLSDCEKMESGSSDESVEEHKSIVKDSLKTLQNVVEENDKDIVGFLLQQTELLNVSKSSHTFTAAVLVVCCLLFSISAHAYRFLRSSGLMNLPHPATLRRICSKFELDPKRELLGGKHFLSYARHKFSHLSRDDIDVILMMDEIHLRPYLDYKGGNILGVSSNTEQAANSAFVFMLQSVKSKFRNVVHILPVKRISDTSLHSILVSIIKGLECIGYKVFCIASDNNSVNRSAMSLFSEDKKLRIVYKHPVSSGRPLFYIIDPVPIIKSVRNNWLDQKSRTKDMFYPAFPGSGETKKMIASFSTLIKMYEIDTTYIARLAYPLTLKALCPTNLERQSVELALQVFNSPVAEGLQVVSEKFDLPNVHGTAEYIRIMVKWFDIMNVKSKYKGLHKLNPYMEPMVFGDIKINFLLQFLDWLESWKSMKLSSGCLTNETLLALQHTSYVVVEIARYCKDELGMEYLLTGKLQTDALEERFSKYRQLCSSQYHISATQLYETEKKIRVQSVGPLMLHSGRHGEIMVGPLESNFEEVECTSDFSEPVDVSQNDLHLIGEILPSLTYIAGYCAHAALRRIHCDICKLELLMEREMPINRHFLLINRLDGLKYPTQGVINVVSYTYVVVSKLLTTFEAVFLKPQTNQRALACLKSLEALDESECSLFDGVCGNGHSGIMYTRMITLIAVNTFLRNYCKKENGQRLSQTSQRGKKQKTKKKQTSQRKLKTLQK